jgi:hypothetical protein
LSGEEIRDKKRKRRKKKLWNVEGIVKRKKRDSKEDRREE